MHLARLLDDIARTDGRRVLAGLIRYAGGDFDTAEDALQDAWARALVRDPNATTEGDVERLRAVGLGDREIFEATAFIAFRLAFSTVNDALGTAPDRQLADAAPEPVRAALSFGRAPSPEPSLP